MSSLNVMKTDFFVGGVTALTLLATPAVAPGADFGDLAALLESVSDSEAHVYRLRDDGGRNMDCLEVFQPAGEGYKGVYGVHHSRKDGVFSVHLSHSMDLLKWTHARTLDEHASQPTIWETHGGAYLLAYEKDAPASCWIRLRFYKDLNRLREGKFEIEFDLPRSLAPTAEGTPSFDAVKMDWDDFSKSRIDLRFHYFKQARVDQLARGTLTDFKSWRAEPAGEINAALKMLGGRGNLGDRTKFVWRDNSYYLQEVQGARGDWGSWRLFLCDRKGMPLRKLAIKTHKKAKAFSNPTVSWFTDATGHRKLVVTVFLHSKGNDRSEAGELLYVIDPNR